MIKHVAVIGNSHITAFKFGWPLISPEYPGIRLTFFGAIKGRLRHLKIDDNRLVATHRMAAQSIAVTSGGLEAIPGNMAGYILVGMGYGLDFLMSVVRKHRTFKYYVEGKSHLISETFEHEAMESVWRDSLAFNIISKVKSITSAPVVFAPCPYLTSEVLTDKAFSGYWDNEAMREEVYARYQKSLPS